MLPYLNTDDYTYLFVDLRGYGHSKEMRGTYSVEEASADAIKLINSLAWNKFHLVGHITERFVRNVQTFGFFMSKFLLKLAYDLFPYIHFDNDNRNRFHHFL